MRSFYSCYNGVIKIMWNEHAKYNKQPLVTFPLQFVPWSTSELRVMLAL